MSQGEYEVRTTTHFDRQATRLYRRNPEFADQLEKALLILSSEPYNTSRRYPIKKLVSITEGQFRLRLRRFRFRYDIEAKAVILKRCSLRSESTYKR